MPKINDKDLSYYLSAGSASGYALYNESVKLYNELRIHADGVTPTEMLTTRRPRESQEILDYRVKNYKPVTKLPISKVITSFGKIRRSPDWMIDFPKKMSAKILDEETLEEYCTLNLPGFTSITDWAFGILLKQNLIDANAVIAVIPIEPPSGDTTILSKPVPIVFNSDQVVLYDEINKYCLLRSKRTVNYFDDRNIYKRGAAYWYIDDLEIIYFEETNNGYTPTFTITNTTRQFPVFKVRAEAYQQFDSMSLNRSRLHAMVPFLDESAAEYSDYQGSKIQHLYPLFWYFQNKDCKACQGVGKIPTENGQRECASCHGEGKVLFSPFAAIQVEAAGVGNQNNPVPPAGYIQHDTEILKMQEESVEKNNYKALAAINMQFLDQTPLNISGLAKSIDRQEVNNTVYNTAEDIIYSIDKVIYFINEFRYYYVIPDPKKRALQLPNIPVPQNFDLLPEDYLMKEVTDARASKVNPFIIATLERQLVEKKFYNQPELAENIKVYFDLDPLPGTSVDEKLTMIGNNGITKEDYILSNYMPSFIKRAVREFPDFCKQEYEAQMKTLRGYAKEKINVIDAAAEMIDSEKQKIIDEGKASNAPGNDE